MSIRTNLLAGVTDLKEDNARYHQLAEQSVDAYRRVVSDSKYKDEEIERLLAKVARIERRYSELWNDIEEAA